MANARPDCAGTHVVFVQAHGLCDGRSFSDVSWSIGAEMTVYLLFPLFLNLLGVHRALPALVALCVVVLLDAAAPWSPGCVSWRMLTPEMGAARAFPGFLFCLSLWAYRRDLARLPYSDGGFVGWVGRVAVGR